MSNPLRLRTFGGLSLDGLDAYPEGGVRPRHLAMMAILASAGPRGATRERVLGILWPDSEPEKGRHALSQTLYSVRRDLEVDIIVAGGRELRIDATRLSSDVEAFREAIAASDMQRAADLYAGPFLDGFFLPDAPEFERWVESERAALALDGLRAIEAGARAAETEGRWDDAVREWRRLSKLDALSNRFACGLVEALVSIGDRNGALAHAKEHVEHLRQELDADPDPAFLRLMSRLRATVPAAAQERREQEHAAGVASSSAVESTPAAVTGVVPARNLRLTRLALVGLAILLSAVVFWRTRGGSPGQDEPVLAVGSIRDLVNPDSAQLGGVLSEMLATSLGRLTDLPVIANSRILELTTPNSDTGRAARTDAARRAGATEILEGELTPLPDQRLSLSLRRVDIARGLVLGGYQLSAADRMSLFDSVTILIASDLRVAEPSGSLADVSTRSPIAYRLYEDGLRAFFQYDTRAAHRLFLAAIKEDSTFAMATYYAWRAAAAIGEPGPDSLGDRALDLSTHASDRDRLLITTHVGATRSDLRAAFAAESLVALFPNDPEALLRAGSIDSDLARGSALVNRSIAIDSATVGSASFCRMCESLHALFSRYQWADSLAGAEQTVRRWIALRPRDATPWMLRADLLVSQNLPSAAEAALKRGLELGGSAGDPDERKLQWSLRLDDLVTGDSLCRLGLSSADRDTFLRYRWPCTIALRMAGRYRDALILAREGRYPGIPSLHRGLPQDRVHAALLDLEMGRPFIAARGFEEIASAYGRSTSSQPGTTARKVAWNLTLAATAAVEGNDTIRARGLVDSIEATGGRSLYARDPVLHLFVRGLLLARAQHHDDAVRNLRAAVYSPSFGYSRVSFELGRSLLALGRPLEAVDVARRPLHGGIDGSGLYLTRTELHELLAQAFVAAGQRDSATAHYAIVERAWRRADPILARRHQAAKDWLAGRRRGAD